MSKYVVHLVCLQHYRVLIDANSVEDAKKQSEKILEDFEDGVECDTTDSLFESMEEDEIDILEVTKHQ